MSVAWQQQKRVQRRQSLQTSAFVSALMGSRISSPRLGTANLLNAMNTSPWLRAVVGKVAWVCGSVQWKLYATTKKDQITGDKRIVKDLTLQRTRSKGARLLMMKSLRANDDLKEIEAHPALDTLEYGNLRMGGLTMRMLTQQYLDLAGECLWLLDFNGAGVPSAIWPVPPSWVTEIPNIQRMTYLVNAPFGFREVPIEETVNFVHPNPFDPYGRGTGTGHSLGDEIETDEESAKTLKAWFKNRARPDVLITSPGLRMEEIQRMENAWVEKLAGSQKVAKPHFINREVEVHEMSQTFQEMELPQLRSWERDCIIHVYGLSPEALGIIEHSNRSTIDAADYMVAKYVAVPRLEFMREVLQRDYVSRYDERLVIDYESPVQEDKEFALKAMQAQPAAFTVDEHRKVAGLPEMPDKKGEGILAPSSVIYVSDITELEAPDPMVGIDPETGLPTAQPLSSIGTGDKTEEEIADEADAEEDGPGKLPPFKPGGKKPKPKPGKTPPKKGVSLLSLSELSAIIKEYDPNQPRDEYGRWTDAGGAAAIAQAEEQLARLVGSDRAANQIRLGARPLSDVVTFEGRTRGDMTPAEQQDPRFQEALAIAKAPWMAEQSTQADEVSATELDNAVQLARANVESDRWFQDVNIGGSAAHFSGPDGQYTIERQAIHEQILNTFESQYQAPRERPTVVVTGGLPGAGKTVGLEATLGAQGMKEFVNINSDDVKAMLPEFNGANAGWVHEESDHVARIAFNRAVQARQNVILDVTMKSEGLGPADLNGGLAQRIQALKERGYEVRMQFTDVDMKTSTSRAVTRYLRSGRFVPPQYIRSSRPSPGSPYRSKNRETFEKIKKYADKWEVFDNTDKLKKIAEG